MKIKEEVTDRRRGGKTISKSGQEWTLPAQLGQLLKNFNNIRGNAAIVEMQKLLNFFLAKILLQPAIAAMHGPNSLVRLGD